jgi:hypothetical protein
LATDGCVSSRTERRHELLEAVLHRVRGAPEVGLAHEGIPEEDGGLAAPGDGVVAELVVVVVGPLAPGV